MTNYIHDNTLYFAKTADGKVHLLGRYDIDYDDCGGGTYSGQYGLHEEQTMDAMEPENSSQPLISLLDATDFWRFLTHNIHDDRADDIQSILDWNQVTEDIIEFCVSHAHCSSLHYGLPREFPEMWRITAEGIQTVKPEAISCESLRQLIKPSDTIFFYTQYGQNCNTFLCCWQHKTPADLTMDKLNSIETDEPFDENTHTSVGKATGYLCELISQSRDENGIPKANYPKFFALTE